jgi:hypothetical protein
MLDLLSTPYGGTVEFVGTDDAVTYERNLVTQPNDWHYRHKPISYVFNSAGYRASEWNHYDWSESVVLLGCSYTLGVGVAEDETVSSQLSSLLSRPVINLGVAASSCWFSYHNSQRLHKSAIRPWAIVQLWTDPSRLTEYVSNGALHLGSWSPFPGLYGYWNASDHNSSQHVAAIQYSDRIQWHGVKYVSASVFPAAALLGCELLQTVANDLARDRQHHGRQSNRRIAEQLRDLLYV